MTGSLSYPVVRLNIQRLKFLPFILLVLVQIEALGQIESDTVTFSKDKCGMSYIKYMYHLLPIESQASFSYVKRTTQDSLLLDSTFYEYSYLIFQRKNGTKLFEGNLNGGLLTDSVRFYFKSGNLESVRIYGNNYRETNLVGVNMPYVDWTDIPYEIGKWRYYSKKGKLLKEIHFLTLSDPMNIEDKTLTFYRIKKTIISGKKEKIEQLDKGEILLK